MTKSEPVPEYTFGGPVTECPACTCEWFLTPIMLDRDTQFPGLIGLDVACYSCGALCKLATPLDDIPREMEEVEYDDDDVPFLD